MYQSSLSKKLNANPQRFFEAYFFTRISHHHRTLCQ